VRVRLNHIFIVLALATLVGCHDRDWQIDPVEPPLLSVVIQPEDPISTLPDREIRPDISGDWVVWQIAHWTTSDILGYQFDGVGATTIRAGTYTNHFATAPRVSGDWVAYEVVAGGQADTLYAQHLYTGDVVEIGASLSGFQYDIDGDHVVWRDLANASVNLTQLPSGATELIATNATVPAISGNLVVYNDISPAGCLSVYDLSTGAITPIEFWDIFGSGSILHGAPVISGNRILFSIDIASTGPNMDLVAYDVATGESWVVAPETHTNQGQYDIVADWVVYSHSLSGSYNVYLFDLVSAETTEITDEPTAEEHPRLSGKRIVWSDNRNGNYDIFYTEFSVDPIDAIEAIRVMIAGYLSDGSIKNFGTANSSTQFLNQAEIRIGDEKIALACGCLDHFVQHVADKMSGGHITDAAGQALIEATESEQTTLGCNTP
jgi:beta propeller repeat protein